MWEANQNDQTWLKTWWNCRNWSPTIKINQANESLKHELKNDHPTFQFSSLVPCEKKGMERWKDGKPSPGIHGFQPWKTWSWESQNGRVLQSTSTRGQPCLQNSGTSQFLIVELTISMSIFNSYVSHYQRVFIVQRRKGKMQNSSGSTASKLSRAPFNAFNDAKRLQDQEWTRTCREIHGSLHILTIHVPSGHLT